MLRVGRRFASPATSDPGEPDDALVTIAPVPTADTAPPLPPTTRPPIRLRTVADPGWAAVEISAAPPVEPTAANVLVDQPSSTRFFTLSAIDRSASVAIDDLDPDHMILSAALSPDGAQLAVFEYYRGDDTLIANSDASGRVSITPTASLFQGEPTWSTLGGVGPGAPSVDLDRGFSTIAWPSADHVHVELLDRAFVIDVVPS